MQELSLMVQLQFALTLLQTAFTEKKEENKQQQFFLSQNY